MENSDTSGQVKQIDSRNRSQIVLFGQGAIVSQPHEATSLKQIGHLNLQRLLCGLLATGAIATAIGLVNRWLYTHNYQETDKAYITSDIYAVNTRIPGQVTTVIAAENQLVKKGAILAKIDQKDYKAKLQTAMANLAVVQEQVKATTAKLRTATSAKLATSQQTQFPGASDAAVLAARGELKASLVKLRSQSAKFVKTESNYERLVKLNQKTVISGQTLNQAKLQYDKLLLERNALLEKFKQAQTKLAQAQLNFLDAQTKLAQERINQAQKNFSDSQIKLAQQDIKKPKITPSTNNKQFTLTPQQIEQEKLALNKQVAAQQAEEKKIALYKLAAEKKLAAKLAQQQKIITKLAEQKKLVPQQAEATFKQYEYQLSQATYKAAKNAETLAKAQLKNAQYQLYYTKITAPNSGQINIKRVQLGQKIQPGQTLMALVQQKPWIAADFPEEQLKKIKPGQSVQIKISAITSKTFNGKVQSILPPSQTKYNHLNPPVKISFDPTTLGKYKSQITPGTPVSVKINLQ
jgi:multidrug resistance efflux pump